MLIGVYDTRNIHLYYEVMEIRSVANSTQLGTDQEETLSAIDTSMYQRER